MDKLLFDRNGPIFSFVVSKVREKKEFAGIGNNFIFDVVSDVLKVDSRFSYSFSQVYSIFDDYSLRFGSEKAKLLILKNSNFKAVVKEIRAKLRKVHGVYNRDNYDERLRLVKDRKFEDALKTHKSTNERFVFYPFILGKIFSYFPKPKAILDLGCGLNPLIVSLFPDYFDKVKYFAGDLNMDEVSLLNLFFNQEKIDGKAFVIDLMHHVDSVDMFGKTDVCFLFKVLDVVEHSGHKHSEEIIKRINSRFIVVSFSTKTLSNKNMNYPGRGWIERMLNRLGFRWHFFYVENEAFYVVDKG